MATISEKGIHEKYKQLEKEDRYNLQKCIERGLNLTDCGKYLHCSASTVKKEIDRNKELQINLKYKNRCGLKYECKKHNVCGNNNCTHVCRDCRHPNVSCEDYCEQYNPKPKCKKLKHIGGVCNGCERYTECKLNKWIYNAIQAQKKHEEQLSNGHKGARITKEEALHFAEFLKPLLAKNLSLEVIKSQYPKVFIYSVQTVYNWMDNKVIPIDNMYLPRKVRYSKRKTNSKESVIYDRSYLNSRYYEDFKNYMDEHPMEEVVELDTVEGPKSTHSYIMTLIFRRSNFMLAFKIKDQTSNAIIEVFDWIKKTIGNELFKEFFSVILTDRGKEFTKPNEIECDMTTGEKLVSVFYCDSRQSQQKGKIEKNHEELRKIFPKSFDFNLITQNQLELAMNHVNSYPRKMFHFRTPFKIFKAYADELLLTLNHSQAIPFDKLNLSPSLIKIK